MIVYTYKKGGIGMNKYKVVLFDYYGYPVDEVITYALNEDLAYLNALYETSEPLEIIESHCCYILESGVTL